MASTTPLAILLLLLTLCESAKKGHTHGNKQSYVPSTYGSNLGRSRDQIVENNQYRGLVQSRIKCRGKYCVDGEWKCPRKQRGGDCYDVEHIIDFGGPEFGKEEPCKNAIGNRVMAHNTWNRALGGLASRDYLLSMDEKIRVYGQEMVDNARASIRECLVARYGKRAAEEDFDFIIPNRTVVETDDGVWIFPANTTITFVGCNETTQECDDVVCDICDFIEYVDENDPLSAGQTFGIILAVWLFGTLVGAGVLFGVMIYFKKRVVPTKYDDIPST